MSRTRTAFWTATFLLGAPHVAMAAQESQVLSVPPISLIASLIGLGVALVLLIEVAAVRKIASGGAIAEKISYVVLAVVCLAASALAQWGRNFVGGVTLDQIQFASQVLVVTAMALFAAYFGAVKRALQGYLQAAENYRDSGAQSTED